MRVFNGAALSVLRGEDVPVRLSYYDLKSSHGGCLQQRRWPLTRI
jgi:hypothetical protein